MKTDDESETGVSRISVCVAIGVVLLVVAIVMLAAMTVVLWPFVTLLSRWEASWRS